MGFNKTTTSFFHLFYFDSTKPQPQQYLSFIFYFDSTKPQPQQHLSFKTTQQNLSFIFYVDSAKQQPQSYLSFIFTLIQQNNNHNNIFLSFQIFLHVSKNSFFLSSFMLTQQNN